VASYLLEEARKAISHHEWDDAIAKLQRAAKEDPQLIEVSYLLGTVYEKTDDPAKALAAYRAFRDACNAPDAADGLDARMKSLLHKAERRIGVLGAGEKELDKIKDALADDLLAFAKKHATDDADIAMAALQHLLALVPGQEEARTLLEKLGGTAAGNSESADGPPFQRVRAWRDCLEHHPAPDHPSMTYANGRVECDVQLARAYWLEGTSATAAYILDTEFRAKKEYAPNWGIGLVFAKTDAPPGVQQPSDGLRALVGKSDVVLVPQANPAPTKPLGEGTIDPVEPGKWVHLTLVVDGPKVDLFIGGKRLFAASVGGRTSLGGMFGLFTQCCVSEFRRVRLGYLK
jgi:hypothetical protein